MPKSRLSLMDSGKPEVLSARTTAKGMVPCRGAFVIPRSGYVTKLFLVSQRTHDVRTNIL